jgi:uncharacterized protein YbjT (DUF2867 family)
LRNRTKANRGVLILGATGRTGSKVIAELKRASRAYQRVTYKRTTTEGHLRMKWSLVGISLVAKWEFHKP